MIKVRTRRCFGEVQKTGGEGGIRTPDTLSGMPVFKTGAINHSATSPRFSQFYYTRNSTAGTGVHRTTSNEGGLSFVAELSFPRAHPASGVIDCSLRKVRDRNSAA
jgi:hypothetical protein